MTDDHTRGTEALQRFARATLLERPTPLVEAPRLSAELGVRTLIKRDDLSEVGLGGNKLRKLEFLIGDALDSGCDTMVTFGALQSNHARQSAAACARHGLDCHLLLTETVPRSDDLYTSGGNLLLDELFGATIWRSDGSDDSLIEAIAALETHLERSGATPRWVPPGGSEPLGSLGYVAAAVELAEQCDAAGVTPIEVVVASASGGTQAGLVCGLGALMPLTTVHGVGVYAPAEATIETVTLLEAELGGLLGMDGAEPANIRVDGSQLGAGYGMPTAASREATALFARTEGIVLDPVYTAKAAAGLIERCRSGAIAKTGPGATDSGEPGSGGGGSGRAGDADTEPTVVFVHTGGAPGLFAYGADALP